MGLKCKCSNCEFNNACHCEAGIVNIAENGVCKTKVRRKLDDIDSEYERLEVASEFDNVDGEDVIIQCDSLSCKYNKDHMCTANLVTIDDGIARTKCMTRKPR